MLEVVVAIGVATATAALVWRADPLSARLSLRAAGARLASDLRLAQARSMGERLPNVGYGLQFPAAGDAYHLVVRRAGAQTILRRQALPPRVRVTYARFGGTTPSTVFFTGVSLFGAPSGGGTVTLSAGGTRLCVRVAPATGRARVTGVGCP